MIQLIPVSAEDINLLQDWLNSDSSEELKSYKNFTTWFSLVNQKNRWTWIAKENKNKIGFIDLEKIDNVGHFSFYIAPTERNKRKSKKLLLSLVQKAEELNLSSLEAGVNKNNFPSQKSLESIGFIQKGVDKDGYFTYFIYLPSYKPANNLSK